MPKVELIKTKDGSSSLFLPELNETYHSTHGALMESQFVFVDKGLNYFRKKNPEKREINILEVGFGTGLNVWLTLIESKKWKAESRPNIQFTSLEKFPLNHETVKELNYKKGYLAEDQNLFDKIHSANWNVAERISENFVMTKLETDVHEFSPEQEVFDIIYFDAFAPSRQPDMWTLVALQKMHMICTQGGVFITYCAQGQFKRDLKSAGFEIEALPGPPGKKEMTRGIKF